MNDTNDLTREIFIVFENAQAGPYTEDGIATMYSSGLIDEHTLCWELGYEEWIALRQLSGFQHIKERAPLMPSQEKGPGGGVVFSSMLKAISVALVAVGLLLVTSYTRQGDSATADDEARKRGDARLPEQSSESGPLHLEVSQQSHHVSLATRFGNWFYQDRPHWGVACAVEGKGVIFIITREEPDPTMGLITGSMLTTIKAVDGQIFELMPGAILSVNAFSNRKEADHWAKVNSQITDRFFNRK